MVEACSPPAGAGWRRAQVRGIRMEASDVRSFELVPDGPPLAWTAGAHVELRLSSRLVRHYSLCDAPDDRGHLCIAVKLDMASRGGSRAMHALQLGDWLELRPPRNLFALEATARRPLLLGAGIGITPVLAMFRERLAAGRSVELHYFSRAAGDAAFATQLQRLARGSSTAPILGLHHGLGPDATADRLSLVLTQARASELAQQLGWPAAHVVRESFGAGAAPPLTGGGDAAFTLVLAHSGITCTVAPGQSIVAAAEAQGVYVPTACERGECGACLTRVLGGQPDHRDSLLSAQERAEGATLLPCVSRCLGQRLVLAL